MADALGPRGKSKACDSAYPVGGIDAHAVKVQERLHHGGGVVQGVLQCKVEHRVARGEGRIDGVVAGLQEKEDGGKLSSFGRLARDGGEGGSGCGTAATGW